jgi:hypothetical protein
MLLHLPAIGGRHQRGYIYEASGAFHGCCYVTEILEGKPERDNVPPWLCTKHGATVHGSPSAMAVCSHCLNITEALAEVEGCKPLLLRVRQHQ